MLREHCDESLLERSFALQFKERSLEVRDGTEQTTCVDLQMHLRLDARPISFWSQFLYLFLGGLLPEEASRKAYTSTSIDSVSPHK